MNAFIRPLALGDLDGPSLAIEDTIAVAGCQTRFATDALSDTSRASGSPLPRPPAVPKRRYAHATAVQRAIAAGWHIDTRVNHVDFGAAAAVANGWVQAALAADFTGGVRVGAALHGICGFKPSYVAHRGSGRAKHTAVLPGTLPMYCIGALAPDMQTLIDLAAALDPRFDEALTHYPAAVNVGWLASDTCSNGIDLIDAGNASYLNAKDWSKVQDLLSDVVQAPGSHTLGESARRAVDAGLLTRSHTIRLPGLAEAADAAALIARNAGRAHDDDATTPSVDEVALALRHTRALRRTIDLAFRNVDVIALPTLPATHGELDALTRVFNVTGHPALTLPFTGADGCIQSLQLIARQGDDAHLCAAGRWFEAMFARHPAAQWAAAAHSHPSIPDAAFVARASGLVPPPWMTARAS